MFPALVALTYTNATLAANDFIKEPEFKVTKEEYKLLSNSQDEEFERKFERIFSREQEKLTGNIFPTPKPTVQLQTERASKLLANIGDKLSNLNENYINKPAYEIAIPAIINTAEKMKEKIISVFDQEQPTPSYFLNTGKELSDIKERHPPTPSIFVKKKAIKEVEKEPAPLIVVEKASSAVDKIGDIAEKTVIGTAIVGATTIGATKLVKNVISDVSSLYNFDNSNFNIKKDSKEILNDKNLTMQMVPFQLTKLDYDQRILEQYRKQANGQVAPKKLKNVEGTAKQFLYLYAKDPNAALSKIATDYSIKDIRKILDQAKEGIIDPNSDFRHKLPKESLEFFDRPDIERFISSIYNAPGSKIKWSNASKPENLKNASLPKFSKPSGEFDKYLNEAKKAADNNQVDTAESLYGKAIHELQLGHELKTENKKDLRDVRNYLQAHNKLNRHEGKYSKIVEDNLKGEEVIEEPKLEAPKPKTSAESNASSKNYSKLVDELSNEILETPKKSASQPKTAAGDERKEMSPKEQEIRRNKEEQLNALKNHIAANVGALRIVLSPSVPFKELQEYVRQYSELSNELGVKDENFNRKISEEMSRYARGVQHGKELNILFDSPNTARYESAELEHQLEGKTLTPTVQSIRQSSMNQTAKENELKNITLESEKKGITIPEEIKAREGSALASNVVVYKADNVKGSGRYHIVQSKDQVPNGIGSVVVPIEKIERDYIKEGGNIYKLKNSEEETTANANELKQNSQQNNSFVGHPLFIEPNKVEQQENTPLPSQFNLEPNGVPVNFEKEPVIPASSIVQEVGNIVAMELFSVKGAMLATSLFGNPFAGYVFTTAYNNLLKELALVDRPYREEASKIYNQIRSGSIAGYEKYQSIATKQIPQEEALLEFLKGESVSKSSNQLIASGNNLKRGREGEEEKQPNQKRIREQNFVASRTDLNELGSESVNISPMASLDDQNPISPLVSRVFLQTANTDLIHQSQEAYGQWVRNLGPYPVR